MKPRHFVFAAVISGFGFLSTNARATDPNTTIPEFFHHTGVMTAPESPMDVAAIRGACTIDADCDDAMWCNGSETCDTAGGGVCESGTLACQPHQSCDENADVCVDPDPCITWRGGLRGEYFLPQGNNCLQASWLFDDIQTSKHTSDVLDHYTLPVVGRSTPTGASPLGTVFDVELALWTVTGDGACNPDVMITSSECTESGTIQVGGAPPDLLTCSQTITLPNNDGDFVRCEVDFFVGYRTAEQGAGFLIAEGQATIGGPAASDEFGQEEIWFEDCPPTGQFGIVFDLPSAGFAEVEVCQKPLGTCCAMDGGCAVTIEAECAGTWGAQIGNLTDGLAACEGDGDGDGIDGVCGDNCPSGANPSQEDCDGDGTGDPCESDPLKQDADGDGLCNGVDNCVFIPNPGQEDCDDDGAGDQCDACPCDAQGDSDGDGSCDSDDLCPGFNDNLDLDGDGVPDGCDVCPGSDDSAPGTQDDDDADGVVNCLDQCPGVDDAVFGPECADAIPTTSAWGLIVLTLLLLVGIKIKFGRNRSGSATV